jgi:predicted outer membrane repeat protein
MWLTSILGFATLASGRAGHPRAPAKPCRGLRLDLEQLEDRMLPSNYTAATVSDLIADINAANAAGGANSITLAKQTTFTLTQVNNTSDGSPTGLPVIAAGDNLTIVGNNDTIQQSTASGLRLFDVASGASLTLQNLTLQNAAASNGAAIYSNGSLALSNVTVTGNTADLGSVYIAGGTANLSKDLFSGNNSWVAGGAVYVAAGTVNSSCDSFIGNIATGNGGGAIYATGGSVVRLTDDHVTDNIGFGNGAIAIYNGAEVLFCRDFVRGNSGADIYIDDLSHATATLDKYTFEHTFYIVGHYSFVGNC